MSSEIALSLAHGPDNPRIPTITHPLRGGASVDPAKPALPPALPATPGHTPDHPSHVGHAHYLGPTSRCLGDHRLGAGGQLRRPILLYQPGEGALPEL